MNYFVWIPLEIVFNVVQAWLSSKIQTGRFFFYLVWFFGSLPLWAIVAKYSKNIYVDALIYDSILVVSYSLSLLYFTETQLKPINIVGLLLIFIAMVLIKL